LKQKALSCDGLQALRLTFLPAWLTNLVAACGLAHFMAAYDGGFGVYLYTTSDIEPGYSHVTKNLEIRFFGHNSSTDCPISSKFCMLKHNSMPTKAT